MWCGVPELDRGLRDRSDPAPFLRGASTTTYASSKLNRVGRKAARYDSGLSAHKCTRPAHKRPTPHRIAVDCCAVPQDHLEQIACSRSRCGNSTPFTALFPPLPPVNPCQHPGSLPFAAPPPSRQHNHARYDETGQVLSVTDACGNSTCSDMPSGSNHTTTYSYADIYSSCGGAAPPSGATNAYLTRITDALGHTQSFCYGYDDGQLRGSTDQNSQTTIYKYNDSFRRLTETDYPDGGQTTLSYNDSAPSPSVTTSKKIDTAGRLLTSVNVMDGLGHVVKTQLCEDGSACTQLITTDTTFDGLSRVWKQSNPHRAAASSTDGTTIFTYDALGRTTQVAQPDGSAV